MRARPRFVPIAVLLAATTVADARADDDDDERGPHFLARKSGYAHLFATALVGGGLRFNNPYRLATSLGHGAESVSRTATSLELGLGATLGDALGVQHGGTVRLALALEGVPQAVITPSYVLWRRWSAFAAYARAGVPVVVTPTRTFGLEGAAGAVWFVRGGLGLTGEMVADVFWGAGTRERATPAYPVVSAQAGILVAYEVLP